MMIITIMNDNNNNDDDNNNNANNSAIVHDLFIINTISHEMYSNTIKEFSLFDDRKLDKNGKCNN